MIISGKDYSQKIKDDIQLEIEQIRKDRASFRPGLAIIQVGGREDSSVYIRMKLRAADECGINAQQIKMSRSVTQDDILRSIGELNADANIHGIIVQLPFDSETPIDENVVINSIALEKDVDGLSEQNAAKLARGQLEAAIPPCTPAGCLALIQNCCPPGQSSGTLQIAGKKCVVIGRSKIVGAPMASLLMWHHGTVTVCHSKTQNIEQEVAQADILVVAIGKPQFVRGEWIKPGACVIDCGINSVPDATKKSGKRLVGDVEFEAAKSRASWITPVPGGVGPMTVAMLLKNTLDCEKRAAAMTKSVVWSVKPSRVNYQNPIPADVEISKQHRTKPIQQLAAEIGLAPSEFISYGVNKAKIDFERVLQRLNPTAKHGKYVVVTGINPTPLGEGKSTTTVGLVQALQTHLRVNTIACLRQPSQGPTFGIKGGAAGGGYSQVVPMQEFNLHLTGDMHAITATNNLIVAALDTRMLHEASQSDAALYNRLVPLRRVGDAAERRHYTPSQRARLQKLGIIDAATSDDADDATAEVRMLSEAEIRAFSRLDVDPRTICVNRVIDTNDRFLRSITVGQADTEKQMKRETQFDITVASEIMAILALSTSLADLRARIGRMVVAFSKASEQQPVRPITVEDLGVAGAATVLMKDAVQPNLMQTLEGGPVLVHAGPFANIAHGNSSVIADLLALKLVGQSGFVVTEAGFGADIGMEKFFNIKCRYSGLTPNCAVLVVSTRALKMHGGGAKVAPGQPLPADYLEENCALVDAGCANMVHHIGNVRKFGLPVIVAINRFKDDFNSELSLIREKAVAAGAEEAIVCNHWAQGGLGAKQLAETVVSVCHGPTGDEGDTQKFRFLYELQGTTLKQKIETIAKQIYGASNVEYSEMAETKLEMYAQQGYAHLPICIAKTHLSLSHCAELLGVPKDFVLPIKDVRASIGAGFIYPLVGSIVTMPGFATRPSYFDIDIDLESGEIIGLM